MIEPPPTPPVNETAECVPTDSEPCPRPGTNVHVTDLLGQLSLNKELYLQLGLTRGRSDDLSSGFVELSLTMVNDLGQFEMLSNKELNTIVLNALLPVQEDKNKVSRQLEAKTGTPEAKEDDWACACGMSNFASRRNCRKCNQPKGKANQF